MGRTSDARERLTSAARELLAERGYNRVSVNDVCVEAGVRKGSFHYFFGTKQALAHEVIESFWADFEASLAELLDAEGSALSRIEAFLVEIHRRHGDCCARSGSIHGCLLGNLAQELSASNEEVRDQLATLFGRFRDRLAAKIAEGSERGELPPGDSEARAEQLLAYVEGSILLAKVHNDPALLTRLWSGARALLGVPPS